MVPLGCLTQEEWAEVIDITGEPHWVARIGDFGLHIGARLRMVQPGDPCICQVGNARISLRLDQRSQIYVRPAPVESFLRS